VCLEGVQLTGPGVQDSVPARCSVECAGCVQMYEARVTAMQSNRFVVAVVFTNLSPDAHLKDLDLNVLDSLNTKLMRGVRLSYLLCQKPRNLCISWTWTGLGGHWHLIVLVSIFNIFLFLATCARLS